MILKVKNQSIWILAWMRSLMSYSTIPMNCFYFPFGEVETAYFCLRANSSWTVKWNCTLLELDANYIIKRSKNTYLCSCLIFLQSYLGTFNKKYVTLLLMPDWFDYSMKSVIIQWILFLMTFLFCCCGSKMELFSAI